MKSKKEELNDFVRKQRGSLKPSISEDELEDLAKESGFSKEEIKEENEEIDSFWGRN